MRKRTMQYDVEAEGNGGGRGPDAEPEPGAGMMTALPEPGGSDTRPADIPDEIELLEDGEEPCGDDVLRRLTHAGEPGGEDGEAWDDAEARLAEGYPA